MNHEILTDPYATFEAVIAWAPDTRKHERYADNIDDALESLPAVRRDAASKYARKTLTAECKAVVAELDRVRDVLAEIEPLRMAALAAKGELDATVVAVGEATEVDALVRARAANEIAARKARVAFAEFRTAAQRAVPKSLERFDLYKGQLRALDVLDFLREHEGALAELEDDRHTQEEGIAYDGARSYAGDALAGDVPWIIADIGDEDCRVYKVWLSVVGPRFDFKAPTHEDIFDTADAAAE